MRQQNMDHLRVFISHAASDREAARRLARTLTQQHGARVFAVDMLSAGGDWQTALRNEIADSDMFIALMSPEALSSAFVLQEIGAAWALEKPVVLALKGVSAQSLQNWSSQFMVPLDDLDDPEVMRRVLARRAEAGIDAEA